jgi:hypothetical protein
VLWKRPEEIIKARLDYGEEAYDSSEHGTPIFIDGGASSNDVRQSPFLGDCWFMSALSLIASDDRYLRGDFDPFTAESVFRADKNKPANLKGEDLKKYEEEIAQKKDEVMRDMTTGVWAVNKNFSISVYESIKNYLIIQSQYSTVFHALASMSCAFSRWAGSMLL